ncbi:MAG: TIGR03750 family conjugal transfer protein [Parahaliea sp.]
MAARDEMDFIPDRLNEEPVIFLSMTNSEIKYSALVSLLFWTPVCSLLGLLLGSMVLGFGASLGMVFATMWLLGKRLRVIKRGKPRQYHVMALRAWLQDHGLGTGSLIRQSKVWDIKRSKRSQGR